MLFIDIDPASRVNVPIVHGNGIHARVAVAEPIAPGVTGTAAVFLRTCQVINLESTTIHTS